MGEVSDPTEKYRKPFRGLKVQWFGDSLGYADGWGAQYGVKQDGSCYARVSYCGETKFEREGFEGGYAEAQRLATEELKRLRG